MCFETVSEKKQVISRPRAVVRKTAKKKKPATKRTTRQLARV